jgi:precorrin-2/cobalt-factor-2 C20-methyltransferase
MSLSDQQTQGRLIGVGVGPGDPELLTLKALRQIQRAPVISYLANAEGRSQAKEIAREAFVGLPPDHPLREIPIVMPMSTDRRLANQAYDHAATQIAKALTQGLDVVFLCEGDPLFFGSFAYLLERLQGQFTTQVVPGISSVHAAASQLQQALTLQQESFAVVSGRHTDQQIRQTLQNHDSVVIMKAGLARPRILALLAETQRSADARYLEYIGRDNQRIEPDVTQLVAESGPYFSLFVVTRQAARL